MTEPSLPPPQGKPADLPPPQGQPADLPPPQGQPYDLPPPPDAPPPPAPAAVPVGEQWRQLDPRMLFLGPARTLLSLAVPMLVAVFGFGQGGGSQMAVRFAGLFATLAVLFGLIPWFTTRYRVTSGQLQVRRGLLNRTVLTAPLDRVRSVDLEAGVLHRVLGLAKVRIGTGVDDTRIELDSLGRDAAAELRRYLLRRIEQTVTRPAAAGVGPEATGPAEEAGEGTELARIDWSWLRYAPFSLSSLAVVAGVGGVGSQVLGDVDVDETVVQDAWGWLTAQAVPLLVLAAVLLVLLAWVVVSTLNYVLQWWRLRLVREPGGTLRLTRGLLTTRSTTVEETRVRGARVVEPLLLRLVHGAELFTLATGVGSGGTTRVLPPCPWTVTRDVGHTVLRSDRALSVPLVRHGPRARTRQVIQTLDGAVLVTAALAVATWFLDWPWPVVPAGAAVALLLSVGVGLLAYRNLGHELTEDHLIAGSGALNRSRTVLERGGIIGWVVRQTFFQRRRGLATLVATTAAGPEQVEIRDLPLPQAVALADAATPGLLDEWLLPAGDGAGRGRHRS
ncbi:PH domain-containing protein [Ornithinicoccus halotolerans]|uniref:PH domain-containing protein n=1 Tax=Ornithinicoccus halotolerans TaxID=1748220 RepID=UPI0012968069|nr:PH domain-containing protein [Ornithinicoccus halotolerans]